MFQVLSPVGETVPPVLTPAPPLDTLDGKTVCEAYNGLFRGETTFPQIRKLLRKRYPGVKIVPYTDMPNLDILNMDEVAKQLPAILREKRCDALITGNGG